METVRYKYLPEVYSKARQTIQNKLKDAAVVCIILDIWSSKNMMGFIGFSCSTVTNDFERQNMFLSMRKLEGRHTADKIFAEYQDTLEEWSISSVKVPYLEFTIHLTDETILV